MIDGLDTLLYELAMKEGEKTPAEWENRVRG
jgi:hypothetical protein